MELALLERRPSFSWSLSTVFTAATVVSTSTRAPRVPALAATWTPRVLTFDAAFFTLSTSPRLSVAMPSSPSEIWKALSLRRKVVTSLTSREAAGQLARLLSDSQAHLPEPGPAR